MRPPESGALNSLTVFIDMERRDKPVLFVTPGKGKETVKEFKAFLEKHDGDPEQILEVVCDMSPAFLSGVAGQLPKAQVTVDWFHIVQTFTRALDDVRKAEGRVKALPKHLRWAVLKRGDVDGLTTSQLKAMAELLDQGLDTATAWRVKERLRWVRQAPTPRAAKWRITRFINYASELVGGAHLLEPVRKALQTLRTHAERVVRRWTSTYTNARLEGLNGLFQAARARARGYRNTETFMTMIYLIASPAYKGRFWNPHETSKNLQCRHCCIWKDRCDREEIYSRNIGAQVSGILNTCPTRIRRSLRIRLAWRSCVRSTR